MQTKRIAAALIVVALSFSQFSVALADKKKDAQDTKKKAQEELNKKNNEIKEIEAEQNRLQEEIDALDAELVQVMVDLSTLEEELAIKEDNLAQTKEQLEQAKADEANQYEAMKKRIQFMYERGGDSLLTNVLESDNLADMLNQVEYFNQIYDYDRNLLVTYKDTKEQVAALEVQQEQEVAAMEETRVEYQTAATNFQNMIASKSSTLVGFDDKLKEARQLAAQYQDSISAQNSIIAQEEAREEEERRRQEEENKKPGGNGGNDGGNNGGNETNNDGGNKNPGYVTGISGSDVVAYARSFVGNPYVWGGKDPNTGADCSGFTSYVYKYFGISIPSYSYSQRSVGQEVSYSNAQPGDLICYEGHVAIYMGNGKIVHAKGTAYGIVEGDNATYRKIVTVRRVL